MDGDFCEDKHQQWAVQKDDTYQSCGPSVPQLPAGAYSISQDCYGRPTFQKRHLQLDDLIDLSDSMTHRVVAEMDHFWSLAPQFHQYGFLHRRGYLFYGKQGGGKSSLIHQIIDRVTQANCIAFWCEYPHIFVKGASAFRRIEPERPMICIFEDIDALIGQYGDCDLLQWLDGNHQVDKAINIATTNYPERLDPRIVSRPRRFDRLIRIDPPTAALRSAFFARKLPNQSASERNRWVELTDGLPFSHLSEIVISVLCLGNTLEDTLTRLRGMDTQFPTSDEFKTQVPSNGVSSEALNGQPAD